MKPLFAVLLLFVMGCKSSKKPLSMPGAYKMLSQSVKNAKYDTTYTTLQQLKIFTDNYMMYANINLPDSTSSFGIGSYNVNKDTVTENVIFTALDSTKNDTHRHFYLIIEKTAKGYKQVIPEVGTGDDKYTLTENYESTGTAIKTPLDGAWKLVNAYMVTGKDTTKNMLTQYKTYYAGYCIWGQTWNDSQNKNHTGIGYGKFEMTGSNKVKESMIASTFSSVRGHDFNIDIEMNGTDDFKQTLNNSDGSKSIEVYQRLK